MRILKKIFSIAYMLISTVSIYAQEVSIDSINSLYNSISLNDTFKIKLLLEISENTRYKNPEISTKSALKAIDLIIDTTSKDKILLLIDANENFAIGNAIQGKNDIAIDYFFKNLYLADKIHDSIQIGKCYNNLGNVFKIMENTRQAIVYYKKAYNIFNKIKNDEKISIVANNLGNIYGAINQFDSAFYYHNISKNIKIKNNDEDGLNYYYTNVAILFEKNGLFDSATFYINKANEYLMVHENYDNLLSNYLTLGRIELIKNNFSNAIEYAEKIIKIAKEKHLTQKELLGYDLSKNIYAVKKDFEKAFYYSELRYLFKDSISKLEFQNQLSELNSKYQNEKKEQQIKLLKKQKQLNETKLKQNFIILIAIVITLIVIIIFSYALYKRLKLTKFQNTVISLKNKEITDSITYAKRIQTAILPRIEKWKELLPDSFIYYLPKDIVAGDFYWLETGGEALKTTVYFAAADCTGHGVPGAMVSVVCSNALSKAVVEEKITEPGKILDRTRELVIERFAKSSEDVKDGMDISLCAIDFKNMTLQWAGANNPLWIVRNVELEMLNDESKNEYSTFNTQNLKLIEIKPDKQPIGKVENPQPFTTHTIELQKGDTIYIFTDGFADQFGGKKGKKFKYKPFKELLLSIQDKSMDEQKQIIEETFIKWKGDLEQVDDVCVIGVRI